MMIDQQKKTSNLVVGKDILGPNVGIKTNRRNYDLRVMDMFIIRGVINHQNLHAHVIVQAVNLSVVIE